MADRPMSVGVLMFVAHREMERRVMAALAAAGYDDITLAQARVAERIAPGGSRLTELAEAAQVSKQTAGYLVDQLARAGYVERVPDPTDGRARLVRLAARGRELLPIADATTAAVEREWARHLGAPAMAQLRRHLTRLREITDPYR
ncbi:MAG TPA: MarR family transcriptional regulator [Actinocatenispora sp.]